MPRTNTMRLLHEQKVVIPDDVTFDALGLRLLESGAVTFDFDTLRRVWVESGYHLRDGTLPGRRLVPINLHFDVPLDS